MFKKLLISVMILVSGLGQVLGASASVTSNKPAAAVAAVPGSDWPMAGANPQRTSWTAEQVPSAAYLAANRNQADNGMLHPQWAKPIAAYIPQKVQIIAANNTLYVSTSRGLYALAPDTGAVKWIFPTELPLGHSPTIAGNVAYVGGLDHRLYAIDATTGSLLWSYDGAGAGFDTNPLVVNGMIYAGNRDGYMYAIYANEHPQKGQRAWRYKTAGPIHFSAAYDGTDIYFASDDSYGYALDALTGNLVWKSSKLLGAGFHSWWPVVYSTTVVFAGSSNYRDNIRPGTSPLPINIDNLDREVVQGSDPNNSIDLGKPFGQRGADGWINTSQSVSISGLTASIKAYYEAKPWRRTYFVVDKNSGQEIAFDFDNNGKAEYAPFLWFGPQSGNRYPPLVGSDGLLYQSANIYYNPWIGRGMPVGWRHGTSFVSTPSAQLMPMDEPIAYAAGGNIIYWNATGDQYAGAFDLAKTNTRFWDSGSTTLDKTREWSFWSEGLAKIFPGYDVASNGGLFGGQNGAYGDGGDQNPPIPYQGRVYLHRGNAVIALAPQQVTPVVLPTAPVVAASGMPVTATTDSLTQSLAQEVQNIISAGHLKPGYFTSGLIDLKLNALCADRLQDYFHNPADTLYTLLLALPYLSPDLAQSTRAYLQSEFAAYPPLSTNHIGWKNGANRSAYDLPPEIVTDMANLPANQYYLEFPAWSGQAVPPFTFYALWKYAQEFGGAQQLFAQAKGKLSPVPADNVLAKYPFAHNAFIAGHIGYIELAKLAGDTTEASNKQATLNTLLTKRAANFSKDTPYTETNSNTEPAVYCRSLSASRNFIYLVPELGAYLRSNALSKVQAAVDEYQRVVPYWFVAWYEDSVGEAMFQPLYDVRSVFAAKDMILKQPRNELAKYLDVPAFARGDLFYIQNLVSVLATESGVTPTPTPAGATPTSVPSTPTRTPTFVPSPTLTPVNTATPFPTNTLIPPTNKLGTVTALSSTVGLYQKFDVKFSVDTIQNPYLPYTGTTGVNVDMVITAPNMRVSTIPCFYYQPVDANLVPTGLADWRCRYAPDQIGAWSYFIKAQDRMGTGQSGVGSFSVVPSSSHGFVKVAPDTRYFEFSDGAPFHTPLINIETGILNGLSSVRSSIPALAQAGTNFVRWFPSDEGANYYTVPFGGNLRTSWGFGSAGTVTDGVDAGRKFTFKPEYYTWQDVTVNSGRTYRLTVRARVQGDKVLRIQVGSTSRDVLVSDWQVYTLTATATSNVLMIALRDVSGTNGAIRLDDIQLRESGTGPNLVSRGLADTYQYVDQAGAARLDEIMKLSEQYGVYHKLTLFHKNDEILRSLNADGTVAASPSIANFYTSPAALQYEAAYTRYFMARWGYSTALHSIEYTNENDLSTDAYNASNTILQVARQNQTRPTLISNSFFGYLPIAYWSNSLLDYADKHWYASAGSTDPDLVSTIYQDIAANVRQCQLRFDEDRVLAKPIVRGETGVWAAGGNYTQIDLGSGRANYHHKQLWAQAGDQCGGEWYTTGINLSEHAAYQKWLGAEPLNRGGYVRVGTDLTGTRQIGLSGTSGSIRAWGQINPSTQRGIIWVDNAQDTWWNIKTGTAIAPAAATFSIAALPAGSYLIEMINTTTGMVLTQTVVSAPSFSIAGLAHDMAIRIVKQGVSSTPTSTPAATLTPLPTNTSTPTRTPTALPTATPLSTNTPTPLATATKSATPLPATTSTPTRTPTATKAATVAPTNTPAPTRTTTPVPANGLVLALGLNENTGTAVADTSGLRNNGTTLNTAWTTGKFGNALSFNGTSSWVTVNSAASLNLTNRMTLEAWVYPTTGGGWRTVVMKESAANYYLDSSNGSFTGAGPSAGLNNGSYLDVYGSSGLPLNTWSHLAATWDGTTFRVYVNGVQIASKAVSGIIASTTSPLRIGGNSIWGEFFAGKIDEVRIYNRALSQTEIQTDMNAAIK